jgi:SAM-dependent methyltransferase
MAKLDAADFEPRGCPHCGSAKKNTLLELDADAIIRSNWSYRPGAAATMSAWSSRRFSIVQCQDCEFMYAGLLPTASFAHQLYDVVIDSDKVRAANLSRASLAQKMSDMSVLFSVIPATTASIRLLDYGCGFGPALEVLRTLPGVRALGYETSAIRLQDLANRGLAATGDLSQVSMAAPFNVVLLDNVLEHLPDPRDTLSYLRGICAPGAVLYVSVPSISRQTLVAQDEAVRNGASVRMDINPWEHLNYFDLEHLDSQLLDFGFAALGQSSFPDRVNIGLRASTSATARLKNVLASLLRMCRYAWSGESIQSVNRRFYRLEPQ